MPTQTRSQRFNEWETQNGAAKRVMAAFVKALIDALAIGVSVGVAERVHRAGTVAGKLAALSDTIDAAGTAYARALGDVLRPLIAHVARDHAAEYDAIFGAAGNTMPATLDALIARWFATYTYDLVSPFTDAMRDTLRAVFASPNAPRTVDETARLLRGVIGLDRRRATALAAYHRQLVDAGTSNVDRLVERYRDRAIRQRATTIARTETIRGINAAKQELYRVDIQRGAYPSGTKQVKEWIANPTFGACDDCAALHGHQVPFGSSFASGFPYPPLHPMCRCTFVVYTIDQHGAVIAA